jgi:transcriptional regulator with XRE-family HTH domain
MTQQALALRLGISQSHLSHLEAHPGEINVELLLAWSAAVGLSLSIASRSDPQPMGASDTPW